MEEPSSCPADFTELQSNLDKIAIRETIPLAGELEDVKFQLYLDARRLIESSFKEVQAGLVVPLIVDSPSSLLRYLLGSDADKVTQLVSWVSYSSFRTRSVQHIERSELITRLLRSRRIALTMNDFLYIHNIPTKSVDWKFFISKWAVFDFFGDYITLMKYHTLWLSFRHRQNHGYKQLMAEPVCKIPCPDLPGLIINSSIRNRMIQILTSKRDRAWRLSEDLLIGLKRGLPSMDETEVKSKVFTYVREMATPLPVNEILLHEIERTCRELTGGQYLYVDHRTFRFSDRAGVGAPLHGDGIKGWIRREFKEFTGVISPEFVGYLNGLDPQPRYEIVEDYWEAYCDICEKYQGELLGPHLTRVQVSPIYEPLKVRLITKGEPFLYSLLKPFQQIMWDCLRKCPMFRLIGEEVSDQVLRERLSIPCPTERDLYLSEEPEIGTAEALNKFCFASGDYSAATDNIPLEYTIRALETLFPPYTMSILRKAIGQQVYEVPKGSCGPMLETREAISKLLGRQLDDRCDYFVQRRGQLMGSPLSFPILCIINAAVYRFSVEMQGERFMLEAEKGLNLEREKSLYQAWRSYILKSYFGDSKTFTMAVAYGRRLAEQDMHWKLSRVYYSNQEVPAGTMYFQGCPTQDDYLAYQEKIRSCVNLFDSYFGREEGDQLSVDDLVNGFMREPEYLDDLPCLINGDDIVFRTTTDLVNNWEFYCKTLGWTLSPGKSFVSKEFIQINSQTRRVEIIPRWNDLDSRPSFLVMPLTIIPFNNYGFLAMMGKDVKVSSDSDIEKVCQNWADKMPEIKSISRDYFLSRSEGSNPEGRVMDVLRHNFRAYAIKVKELGLMPFVPDLNNPFELGGFGLGHNPETGEISNFNLEAATQAMQYKILCKPALFTESWTEKCDCKTSDDCPFQSCRKRKWVKMEKGEDPVPRFIHDEDHKTYLVSNRIEQIDKIHFVRSKIGPSFTY
jgi:hypothetical protein